MINNHSRNITKRIAGRERLPTPLNIFGNFDASKWSNSLEILLSHSEIAGSRIAVLLDIKFKAIGKYAFVGLDRCHRSVRFVPNLYITSENCSGRRALKRI